MDYLQFDFGAPMGHENSVLNSSLATRGRMLQNDKQYLQLIS